MIIVKLMGGLGNQMFQYALGRRISLLRNTSLKMDISFLNDKSYSHTPRKYELDIFSADIQIAAESELNKFETQRNNKIKRAIHKLLPFISPYKTIHECIKEYDADILMSPKNSLLVGYWQTEKYFLPIQEIIRSDFEFKKPLEGLNKNVADTIGSLNSVSVHIRRGDYVNDTETNQFHGTCNPEYYYASIKALKRKVENIQLFIFSDDMEWVKLNMRFDVPVIYVDTNKGENSYIDMQLMSLCKHNIIANSSFSWWGAWLNKNPDKLVVAPAKWFENSSVNTQDIIPEGWLKV